MKRIEWLELTEGTAISVPATPEYGFWTKIFEDHLVSGPCMIKIQAEGKWSYGGRGIPQCGPDGDHISYIKAKSCLNEKAPVGALIGKIGGSTATVKGDVDFEVGSFCTVHVGSGKRGALFLTMNDQIGGFGDNDGDLQVRVFFSELEEDSPSLDLGAPDVSFP